MFIFQKKYNWTDIDSIKYEYYCQYKNERRKDALPNLKSCIVFSYFRDSKPEWREPYIARWGLLNPLRIFYVNFKYDNYIGKKFETFDNIIDEKYFLRKLEEWNVKVEGLNNSPKVYKKDI